MPFTHYAAGIVFQERNRFGEAEAAAREAIRLDPEDADYWSLLAQCLFSQQKWKDALEAADAGLKFNPEHSSCINLRAMALVKLGDKAGAAATIEQDLRRNPHNALSHANQGWTLLHQNDPKKALEHFREALRLNPNNEWARDGMIQALKAHHLIYRMMLRYYLWMSRFTRKGQWGLIIGFWVGMQVLRAVEQQYPGLAPFIYPVMAAYVVFVFAGWLADPIFSLSLMFSRFGRYLLSRTQQVGCVVVGGLLLGALVMVPVGYFEDMPIIFLAGLFMGLLTLPTSAAYKARERMQLVMMTVYTAACAGAAVVAMGLLLADNESGLGVLQGVAWGCVLSSLASNVLSGMIRKK
jgi:Flp pilus assembly protein TadD